MNPDQYPVVMEPAASNGTVVADMQQPPVPESPNPIQSLHRLLQGRYPYAIVLAIIGAVVLGSAGYLLPQPEFRSTGMISFRPVLPRVLYQSEESNVMPMFDAYVDSQSALLKSQRVLDLAMKDDMWKSEKKIIFDTDKQVSFRDNLDIGRERKSTIVFVYFTDPDPDMARIATKTIINAYDKIYSERDNREDAGRLQLLEQRSASLANQLTNIRDRILEIANEFGSDDLGQAYEFKLGQLNELEQSLAQTGMALAIAGASISDDESEDGLPPEELSEELTVEDIAVRDKRMARLLERRKAIERDLKLMQLRFGSNHRNVVALLTQLELLEQTIEEQAEQYRKSPVVLNDGELSGGATSITQLRLQASNLQKLHNQATAELLDLGRKKLRIDSLKAESKTIEQRLKDTKHRIDQINVESGVVHGRMEILSRDSKPLIPFRDKRKQFAFLGAGAGAMMGVVPVILWGLVNRRLRHYDDVRAGVANVKLLGLIPDLPQNLINDTEYVTITGYCVHHMRTMLQLASRESKQQVIAVTSSTAEVGKTSVTLALGLSFAASGSKTLLIDCDLAGGGLTSRLEAVVRRRIGEVLLRRGLISKDQLERALDAAAALKQELGKTLVELGILTKKQLIHALASQKNESVGLLDAMSGEDIDAYIAKTGMEGLDVLAIGEAVAHDTSRISPASLRRVVDAARERYQTVLIDTGPMTGSAEASMAASLADQVIVVVARGGQEKDIKNVLAALDRVGAHVEGVVFNRAHARDMTDSMSSSIRSVPPDVPQESSELIVASRRVCL